MRKIMFSVTPPSRGGRSTMPECWKKVNYFWHHHWRSSPQKTWTRFKWWWEKDWLAARGWSVV